MTPTADTATDAASAVRLTDDIDDFLTAWCDPAPGPLPVLIEPGAPAAASVRHWSERLPAPTGGHVWSPGTVVAVGDGPAVGLARGYALRTGREFAHVDDWSLPDERFGTGDPDRVLVVVAVGSVLDNPGRNDLGELLGLTRAGVRLGVMAGRDATSVAWLLAKSVHNGPEVAAEHTEVLSAPGFFSPTDQSAALLDGNPQDGVGADRLRALSRGEGPRPGLLVLAAHGRADHLGFGDFPVCGDPLAWHGGFSPPEASAGSRLPQCAQGLGCYLPGPRLAAASLPADILALYSCTSAHLGSDMYEQVYNIALTAAEGPARAVLGTTRPIVDNGWEAAFLTCLLRAGLSAGRVARLLNLVYRDVVGVAPAFLVLGEPDVRLARGASASPRLDAEGLAVDTAGTAFTVPVPAGVDGVLAGRADAGLGAVVVEEDGRRLLVAWQPDGIPTGTTLRWATGEDTALVTAAARGRHALANLRTTPTTLLPPEVQPRLEKLFRLEQAAGAERAGALVSPAARARALSTLERLGSELTKLDEVTVRSVLGRSSSGRAFDVEDALERAYRPLPGPDTTRYTDRPCICGRRLHVTTLGSGLDSAAPMEMWTCGQCGDVEWSRVGLPPVEWSGPEFVSPGAEIAYVFTVPNPERHPVSVSLSLWLPRVYGGRPEVTPALVTAEVPAGESVDVPITLRLTGLVPHRYTVNAVVSRHGVLEVRRRFAQVVAA